MLHSFILRFQEQLDVKHRLVKMTIHFLSTTKFPCNYLEKQKYFSKTSTASTKTAEKINTSTVTQKQVTGSNCGYLTPWPEHAWEKPVNRLRLTLLLNQKFRVSARRAGLGFCRTQAVKLQRLSWCQWGQTSDNPATATLTVGTEGQATCF